MSPVRIDNVLLVVEDMEGAVAFFTALGLEVEGRATVEGPHVDRLVGLDDVRSEIVMMRTPDGQGRIELDRFHSPSAIRLEPAREPVNTLGIRRIMFEVDDLEAALGRLQEQGAELVGELVQYEQAYRLCYVRAPEGFMVALAQPLG